MMMQLVSSFLCGVLIGLFGGIWVIDTLAKRLDDDEFDFFVDDYRNKNKEK